MWQAPNKISGGGLAPRDEGFTQPRSYVEVDSIEETIAAAEKAGGTVAMGKQEISPTSWWAVIVDPDGNHIGIYEGATETGS
jgi:predicted enzyme related to lactoylglutathione lyase